MRSSRELTLEEKILLIEQGRTAAEVHQDPNPFMAFTSFGGPTTSHESMPVPDEPSRKIPAAPVPKPSVEGPATVRAAFGVFGLDGTANDAASTKKGAGNHRHGAAEKWHEDEVTFALEKIVEWPEIRWVDLTDLVNAHNDTIPRAHRSKDATQQRLVVARRVLLERLKAQDDGPAEGEGVPGVDNAS